MKKSLLVAAVAALCSLSWIASATPASAQSEVLAEMYGRGVHCYYAGRYNEANEYLSMAINNGSKDPRAYYFRGLVANATGRQYETENDWRQGAQLEAATGNSAIIGRSLARFQGPERLKLEEIRQKARLEALAIAAARSQQRYGELGSQAPSTSPRVAVPMQNRNAIAPPPIPDAADNNPFADDANTTSGAPKLESDDAFAETMKAEPEATTPSGGVDTGVGGADAGGPADPFGGGSDTADPFGGDSADPFGGDPF
ncbi:hypothetical protein CA13_23850 [Planctomycetes bacterium CA13]|uniref:Tetratricopeptide repeat protein n=1 Tax=Novipirellula herctigrandis TaxID=2527986 RepID=A0A5C5Z0N6_9BACT|nr:hypothetical protein CA13_23850 [Planctomycetes bacterium CA13]